MFELNRLPQRRLGEAGNGDKKARLFTSLLAALTLATFITPSPPVCAQYLTSATNQAPLGSGQEFRRERVAWCTISLLERKKCLDWARAIEEVNIQFEGRGEPFKLNLDCVLATDKDQCMAMIDEERADLLLLDPGEISGAGRHHSLTPIMAERYAGMGGTGRAFELGHFSVAVVRKRSAATIQSLADLYGRRACFSGVSHMASWTLPLAALIDLPRFEIADCNNLVKSASYFFGNSCAPNALINKFNPTGDNPQKMSQLCDLRPATGPAALFTPSNDYNGLTGGISNLGGSHHHSLQSHNGGALAALKCLAEPLIGGATSSSQFGLPYATMTPANATATGDVAFLPHNTVWLAEKLALPRELRLDVPARSELELLCPQGGRAPLDRWASCNFGFVPAHAVIVSSRTSHERREAIQKFLKTSVQIFAGGSSSLAPLSTSSLFNANSGGATTPQQSFQTPGGSLSSFDQLGSQSARGQQQQQQQPLSPFDFGISTGSNSYTPSQARPFDRFNNAQQQQPNVEAGLGQMYAKLDTNFKLTGDAALASYPALDVLFSSDMIDLVPLNGVAQTSKGFLNSFPVQLATTGPTTGIGGGQQTGSNSAAGGYYSSFFQSMVGAQSGQVGADNSVYEIRSQTDYFEKLRRCSVPASVLCVTSSKEFNKCQAMSKAFHAAGLKPELNCKLAQSTLACMQLIRNRDADLVVLDAADIYLAGKKFNLIPIVAEQIDMYDPNHFAVAVAKKSDQTTDLFNLKGKLSCHSGFLKGAGWVMPMHFLLSNERVRVYEDCNSARSAAEHFDKSCAPGILGSISFSTLNSTTTTNSANSWTIRNMCELCHGTGRSHCARDASEPFFGDTGSFRCLVEGGGQVAFCKHTAIYENTGGSNRETWARNLIKSDFELLCRDGSRAPVSEYKTCNLGSVPPNAIVTRGDTPFNLIDAYVNLFMYGQQYYGSKYSEEYTFKMFASTQAKDLIFQDATQQLARIPLANQTYNSYLTGEFLRAMETVYCSE